MRGYFRGLFGDDNIGLMNIFLWGNIQWLIILFKGFDGYWEMIDDFGGIGVFIALVFYAAQFYNVIGVIYIPVYLFSSK